MIINCMKSDNKIYEYTVAKFLHILFLNVTLIPFKISALGTSHHCQCLIHPSLELVLWNCLQSCHCITFDVISIIEKCHFVNFHYLSGKEKSYGARSNKQDKCSNRVM